MSSRGKKVYLPSRRVKEVNNAGQKTNRVYIPRMYNHVEWHIVS
jgi:hypothetical protein